MHFQPLAEAAENVKKYYSGGFSYRAGVNISVPLGRQLYITIFDFNDTSHRRQPHFFRRRRECS
jgi:hypothetical protein